MGNQYRHLSVEERALIQAHLSMRSTLRAIARSVLRAPSTISRELKRGGWHGAQPITPAMVAAAKAAGTMTPALKRAAIGAPPGRGPCQVQGYSCERANRRAQQLAAKPRVPRKLVPATALWERVRAGLASGLSPEQISGTLARMPPPCKSLVPGFEPSVELPLAPALPVEPPCERISHETIYTTLYALPRGELRAQMLTLMRKSHKNRRSRAGKAASGRGSLMPEMRSIDTRPPEIEQRLVPGHWEGDLIKGAGNRSQIGTLVERKTLYTVLVKVEQATAACTASAFAGVLNRVDASMRLSMTYDQGREMAHHPHLTRQTGMTVYFAHPHSPWERGRNENTNGLLRQYYPKGTELGGYSQEELDATAHLLNVRPRKSLGWKCPAELFLPEGSFDFTAYWADKMGINCVAVGV